MSFNLISSTYSIFLNDSEPLRESIFEGRHLPDTIAACFTLALSLLAQIRALDAFARLDNRGGIKWTKTAFFMVIATAANFSMFFSTRPVDLSRVVTDIFLNVAVFLSIWPR